MIETTLLSYLQGALDVPVYMEEPREEQPKRYVLIEKTSSNEYNHIKGCSFAIQSYGETLYDCAVLNEEVKAKMNDFIEVINISSSKLNSDYNFTDTQKKLYRYQAVYDIVYMD